MAIPSSRGVKVHCSGSRSSPGPLSEQRTDQPAVKTPGAYSLPRSHQSFAHSSSHHGNPSGSPAFRMTDLIHPLAGSGDIIISKPSPEHRIDASGNVFTDTVSFRAVTSYRAQGEFPTSQFAVGGTSSSVLFSTTSFRSSFAGHWSLGGLNLILYLYG